MWTTIPGATDDPQPPQMHPTHDNSWSVEKSKQLKPRICEFKLDLFAFIGLALCQWQCSWPRWIAATILSLAPPDNMTGTMWSHLPWFLEFWHYTICYIHGVPQTLRPPGENSPQPALRPPSEPKVLCSDRCSDVNRHENSNAKTRIMPPKTQREQLELSDLSVRGSFRTSAKEYWTFGMSYS